MKLVKKNLTLLIIASKKVENSKAVLLQKLLSFENPSSHLHNYISMHTDVKLGNIKLEVAKTESL